MGSPIPLVSVQHALRIGPLTPSAPVVLAPMAGVTNAPFRTMCRSFAPGLVYVNEMVMATAVVHGNAKTDRMMTFGPDEHPRSLQIYGSDPVMIGEAIRKLCDADRVDHIDINFGCPAAKVTRKGGGAAVPAKPNLLRAILRVGRRGCVAARRAGDREVPQGSVRRVADLHLDRPHRGRRGRRRDRAARPHGRAALRRLGRLERDRRAEGGGARDPGARQRRHLGGGRCGGDDAPDRLRRRRHRSRLPRPAVAVPRSGRRAERAARAAVADAGSGVRGDARPRARCSSITWAPIWRCATSASTPRGTSPAIPVGGEVRRLFATVSTLGRAGGPDRRARSDDRPIVEGGERIRRGHTNGPIRVALPFGYLDHLDDLTVPDDGARDGAQRRMTPRRPRLGVAAPAGAADAARRAISTSHPADIDESVMRRRGPGRLRTPAVVGEGRARSPLDRDTDELVIAADTTVDVDGRILGKPARRRSMPPRCCDGWPVARITCTPASPFAGRPGRGIEPSCTTHVTFASVDDTERRLVRRHRRAVRQGRRVRDPRRGRRVGHVGRRQRQQRRRAAADDGRPARPFDRCRPAQPVTTWPVTGVRDCRLRRRTRRCRPPARGTRTRPRTPGCRPPAPSARPRAAVRRPSPS